MRKFAAALFFALLVTLANAEPRPVPGDSLAPQPSPTPYPTAVTVPMVTPDPSYHDPNWNKWPHIDLEEAKRLSKVKGVLFVDARPSVEWDQGHLPGAISLSVNEFDAAFAKHESKLKKAKVIIPYCHGIGCHLSDKVCNQLWDRGYRNVVGFFGGEPKWRAAGLPMYDKNGKKLASSAPKESHFPSPPTPLPSPAK